MNNNDAPPMIEFGSAFIRDDIAKQKEPFQPPYEFLYTGVAPQVGQRTETNLTSKDGTGWCFLSGIVTEVGELPTFDMWITTSTIAPPLTLCETSPDPYAHIRRDVVLAFPEHCPYPDCTMCLLRKGDTQMSLGTLMERVLQELGTLQNQTITSYAYLNFDFYHQEDYLPVKRSRIYKIIYQCNDDKNCVWCAQSIQDVTDLPPSELPQVFKDWELGREGADVAPFDLSDLDRKVWYLHRLVKLTRAMEEDERRVKQLALEYADDEDFFPEEHARYCGPSPEKTPLFLFARESCPAIMTTPVDGCADLTELKELLRQCVSKFEALSMEKRKVWDDKAAQDLERYRQEKEEFGDY